MGARILGNFSPFGCAGVFQMLQNEDGLYTRVLRLDLPQLNKLGRGWHSQKGSRVIETGHFGCQHYG
jgi:hypothetical protein